MFEFQDLQFKQQTPAALQIGKPPEREVERQNRLSTKEHVALLPIRVGVLLPCWSTEDLAGLEDG